MSNNPTVAKIGESGLVFAKDKTTNQVTTIATTADMQIGLPNQSANLSLTGAIGLSTLDITIAEGSTRSIPDSLTSINVTTTGASGTATLRLPAAPKKGQLVYIKDAGGNAGTVSITVVGSPEGTKTNKGTTSHLIDGSTSKTITANYGILQLLWNSSSWSVISSTASSAPLDASYVVIGSNATLTNERILTAGSGISIVDGGAGAAVTISATGGGSGDVVGPASSTDNAIARFDLTTGKLIQNSGVTISDSNDIITPGDVAINGGDLTSTATTFNLLNSTVTTLNVGGAATTVTVGASTADVVVGRAEIGAWPAGTSYAFFGNSDYNHSVAGNYALIQASSAGTKNTWLNAPTGGKVYIANNDAALGYLDDNEISLTGKASTTQTVTLGSTYGASSLTLNAGTGNIGIETYNGLSTISIGTVNQPRTIEIGTASTQAQTVNIATGGATNDINIGNYVAGTNTTIAGDGVQVYTNGGTIAIDSSGTGGTVNIDAFGYNSSVNVGTGPAIKTVTVGSTTSTSTTTIQGGSSGVSVNSSNGNIVLNPTAVNGTIYLRNNGSDLATFSYNNVLGNTFSNIYLTGKSGDDTFVDIGSSYGSSNVNIYAGTGGILLSGSTTIISSSLDVAYYSFSRADARLGNAEVGSWPWGNFNDYASHFAMFGNEALDHSIISNYALLQDKLGYTYLNAASGKSLHLRSNNTDYAAINPTEGGSPTDKVVIYKVLSASGGTTTYTDAVLGNASIGSWPGYEGGAFKEWYAIFGHKTLDHTTTTLKAGLAQLYTGDTWLNSPAGNKVYLSNNGNTIGYFDDNEISLTGKANVDQTITLGSNYGGSYTRIDGGFLGVFISGSLITLTGSSANASLSADARIGSVEIGGLPGYGNSVAMFGHTDLNHAYNNDTSAGMGNYALGQSNDGSTYINSPQNKGIYFLTSGASGLPLGRIYFKTSTLSSELILTGASYFNSNVFLGSSYGQSSTSIYAGTGGIILSGSGASTIITGSTSTQADAYIGSVEVGTHPFWGRNYAMFSHKDMDNSVDGNAALIQAYDGDTFLGAKSTKSIFIKNGTSFIGKFDNDNIELTGDTSTSTATILGNSYGLSSTKMYAGLFGITLSGSATTTITGSSSTNAEAYIGTAEVGELPYTRTSFPNYFAMFGHKTLDHSSNGNYALVQSYDGDTFLNSANSKSIYLQNAGNLIGTLDNDSISLTGQANTSVATEIGSVYGLSSTTIKGGLFGLILTGSGTTITITGSTTSQADAYIGSAEIGVHPFWGRNYAMFSHKDMDNSVDGNSALIQAYDGDTFLGAKSTKSIYFKNGTTFLGTINNIYTTLSGSAYATLTGNATYVSGNIYLALFGGNSGVDLSSKANISIDTNTDYYTYFKNNGNQLGYIGYSTLFGTLIDLKGRSGFRATVDIGNSSGTSLTNVYAGTGGITLSGSATTVITGSSSGQSDAYIGSAEIGTHPFWGRNYASFSHKDMDNGSDGNAALIQSYDGDTFLGAKSTKTIYIKNGTSFIGKFDNDNIELTGDTSTSTATILGNSYGLSYTNIYSGLFGITLSGSATTTITGSSSGNADAYIGSAEVGVHPYWGRNYAMFGHKDLNNSSDGNAALIQSNVGDTFLGAVNNNYLYFKNGTRSLGYFQYSTFFGKTIFSLDGAAGSPTAVTIGNSESSSNLTLNAGSGSIDIGSTPQSRSTNIATGAAVQTVTLGSSNSSSTLTLDAGSGGVNIGTNPGGSSKTINIGTTTGINTDINVGSEYLASTTVIKAGGPFASLGGMYLTGSTATTYTVGGETGTGTINIGRSTASNTINVGAAGNNTSNTQTINVGNGTGKSVVTIGSQSGVSSLTLDAGGGNIDIGTSATARLINIGTGAANQTISIGNNSTANQVTIYGGTPFVGVGGIYLTGSAGTPYIIGGETGTGTISLGRSTASNTINIGNATTTSGNTQTVNIASSASGTGLAAITIGNTNGASSLTLNAGTGYTTINGHEIIARTALVAYPSDTVTDYPLQLKVVTGGNTVRWAIGADTGDDLNFSYSLNSTTVASRGYLANTADVAAIDFTGQHRNYPVGGNVLDFSDKIGLIVASVGQYKSLTSGSAEISINEALPLVELSTKRNQKSVFGVISDHEDPNETSRDYVIGNWGSVYEKMQNDDRLIINSLGEGAIWICNINGNLQNGDYITSCEVPGYGMKQDDDILHNYTAAKITCDCDFFLDSTVYRCEEFQHEGKTYRRAFVGCTYHCG